MHCLSRLGGVRGTFTCWYFFMIFSFGIQDSSDEKSELNGYVADAPSTVVICHGHRCSVPTDVPALAASTLVDAAFNTTTGHVLSPGLPHASSTASPTLTSTPETNKAHGPFGARVLDGRESSFVTLDDSQHEVSGYFTTNLFCYLSARFVHNCVSRNCSELLRNSASLIMRIFGWKITKLVNDCAF